jgi:hypothetical protein
VAAKLAAVIADDEDTREILSQLRKAGPLHNFEAAKKILDTLARESGATAQSE